MQFNFDAEFPEQIKRKTDKELINIYLNAHEYQPAFVELATGELGKRNISLDGYKQVKEQKNQKVSKQLEIGKAGSPLYITLCFVLALFGGILGIYAGYIYSQSKVKDIEGREFYVYDDSTRKLGKLMMLIGIIAIIILAVRLEYFSD
jgi:hypothetical protein